MRFPDPGQQAAQRAHQQAVQAAQRAHQQAMQDAQRQQQLQQQNNMLRRQRSGGPAPKGGCGRNVLMFIVFLVLAAVLFYVVLHIGA